MFFKSISAKEARRIAEGKERMSQVDFRILQEIGMKIESASIRKETSIEIKIWGTHFSSENVKLKLMDLGYQVFIYDNKDGDRVVKVKW